MNIYIFKNYLKGYGLTIDQAGSGAECLKRITDHAYDLIFMDYMMPEMDGIETFRKMKELDESLNKDVPVIMLTANAVSGMKEIYAAEGFSGFLAKPADKSKIVDILLEFLPAEKITMKEQEEDEPGHRSAGDEKMELKDFDRLKMVFPDMDIEKGLKYCSGSKEFYTELLKDFAVPSRKEELQKAYDERAWELYAVKIHAMKGSARTLGLKEIERITEGLQRAAEKRKTSEDAGAADYMEDNHDKAMELFDTLVGCVQEL